VSSGSGKCVSVKQPPVYVAHAPCVLRPSPRLLQMSFIYLISCLPTEEVKRLQRPRPANQSLPVVGIEDGAARRNTLLPPAFLPH